MLLVKVHRTGEIIPFIICYCTTIIEEEEELTLYHDDSIIKITNYDYLDITETETTEDEVAIVDIIKKANDQLNILGE